MKLRIFESIHMHKLHEHLPDRKSSILSSITVVHPFNVDINIHFPSIFAPFSRVSVRARASTTFFSCKHVESQCRSQACEASEPTKLPKNTPFLPEMLFHLRLFTQSDNRIFGRSKSKRYYLISGLFHYDWFYKQWYSLSTDATRVSPPLPVVGLDQ